MKHIALLFALAVAGPVWAQDKPPAKEPAKPMTPEAVKPMAQESAKKPHAVKHTPRRQEDARRCLDESSNDAIIKCAEEYL